MEGLAQIIGYWRSGGPLLVPLALVCFGMWACFIRSRSRLKRVLKEGGPVEDMLNRTQDSWPAVRARVAEQKGGIAALIGLAMEDMEKGSPSREAFAAREAEGMRILRRDRVLLLAFTAAAPLLGLLGTVMGMIDTFEAVSAVSGPTGSRVAAGISRALITTQFGLVIALPGVFGQARLDRMRRAVEVLVADCRTHVLAAWKRSADGEAA